MNSTRISVGGTGNAVPPIVPDFYEYIEPGILPVVRALRRRGFNTVSSCEGHAGTDNVTRNVVLAFSNIAALQRFRTWVERQDLTLVSALPQEFLDLRKMDKGHDQNICRQLFPSAGPWHFLRIEIGRTTGSDPSLSNLMLWALDRGTRPIYSWLVERSTARLAYLIERGSFT